MTTRPVGRARIERVSWSPGGPWRWEIPDPTAWRFHVGYAASHEAALHAVGEARHRITTGQVPDLNPPDRSEWAGGSCGTPSCRCADPAGWLVCGEWAGVGGWTRRGCPRCGWSRAVHPLVPVS